MDTLLFPSPRRSNKAGRNQSGEIIITCASGVRKLYDHSIRCRKPETYAMLAGSFDKPFYITDFRSLPPMATAQGRDNAGTTHVQINKAYIDHVISRELEPFGKYMLGAWHSHPGNFTQLSRGTPGSGDGDIASMRGTLERAQAMGIPWEYFLAPITTFNADYTADTITTWVLTLDEPEPIPARLVFEEESQVAPTVPETANIDELMATAEKYQNTINKVLDVSAAPQEDRLVVVDYLRSIMRAELTAKRDAIIDRIV